MSIGTAEVKLNFTDAQICGVEMIRNGLYRIEIHHLSWYWIRIPERFGTWGVLRSVMLRFIYVIIRMSSTSFLVASQRTHELALRYCVIYVWTYPPWVIFLISGILTVILQYINQPMHVLRIAQCSDWIGRLIWVSVFMFTDLQIWS